ncbi:MAG: lysostaphin resistance A-like protein [bacterium]
MPPFDPSVAVWVLASLGAAWWVHADAKARGLTRGRAWAWAVFTALLLFLGLPAYLLVGRPRPPTGRWGLGEVVGGTGALIVAVFLLALAFGLRGGARLPELTIEILLQEAVTIAIVWYVVAVRYRLPLSAVGFQGTGLVRLAGIGVGLGILSVAASTVAERIAMEIAASVVGPAQAQRMNDLEHAIVPIEQILRGSVGAGDVALVIALLCVAVPLGEEVFFRGFAYGAMRSLWSRPAAVIVSAAFFAAVHSQIIHFLPIFALGLFMAYAYDRTGSLLPPILVHAINNLIAVLSTLYGWNL